MSPIHQSLVNNVPWYRRWHQNPNHTAHHWIIFIVVTTLVFIGLNRSITNAIIAIDAQNPTTSTEVNGKRMVAQEIKTLQGNGKAFAPRTIGKGRAHSNIKAPHVVITMPTTQGQSPITAGNPEAIDLTIPVPGSSDATLKLARVNGEATKIITANGKDQNVKQSVSYRGVIKGSEDNSLASVTVSADGKGISGFVMKGSKTYIIDVLDKKDVAPDEVNDNPAIIFDISPDTGNSSKWNEGDMTNYVAPGAGVSMQQARDTLIARLVNSVIPTAHAADCTSIVCSVKFYWETRYEIYTSKGSTQAVSDYMNGIFNQVQTLYANDGIPVELKTLYIWNTTDPYTGTSTGTLLDQFGVQRSAGFNGDLGTLIGYSGGGGIAWISGVCNSQAKYKMAYTGISSTYKSFPEYSWSVEVLAHENGHLMGSRHTHDCVWNGINTKIDSCGDSAGYTSGSCPIPGLPIGGGTLMSYCHLTSAGINFNLGFGLQPSSIMRTTINKPTSCLSAKTGGSTLSDTTPPTISFSTPTASATDLHGTSLPLGVIATDNTGIAGVQYKVDGVAIGSELTYSPYASTWNTTTVSDGTHSLSATARDVKGNVATTTNVVTVRNSGVDNTAPVVAITTPANNATLSGTVPVSATASDNVGVVRVEFSTTGLVIGTDTTAPYSVSWNTSSFTRPNTVYSLTAKAYDAMGNVGTTNIGVMFNNVADTIAPTVSLSAPANGATVTGTIPVTANASDNVGVDHVDFYRGNTLIGADATAPYSVSWDTTTVVNGQQGLNARAYDAFGNATMTSSPTYVTVSNTGTPPPPDTTAPAVNLTAPQGGPVSGPTVTLTASASDNIAVTKVEFYRGSTLIDTDTTVPYAVTWNTSGLTDGPYTLTARAYDAAGNTATSTAYTVSLTTPTTNTPPTVSLTSPANGATIFGTTNISANATDTVAVTKVEFYQGSTLLGTDTSTPYSYAWNTTSVANGTYTLTARAYDASTSTTSNAISVIVSNADTTVPTVSLTAPANGAVLSSTIPITATATDNIGIDHVDFYRGSTLIGADATAPYSLSWNTTTVTNGTYSLTARAYDAAGNSKTSGAVSVSVSNTVTPPPDTTVPVVSVTTPASTLSSTATLSASATDNIAVTKVQFYQGATLIDTDTTAPYAVTWNTTAVSDGSYSITAKAYDAAGNTATSSPVTMTVSNVVTPPPSGTSFTDDFSRADGSLSSPWEVMRGAFAILSNELKSSSGLNIATYASSNGSSTQTATGSFAITTSSTSVKLGLVLRYQDPSNYYACYRVNGGTSTRRIVKVVNGTETILAFANIGNPSVNVYFPLTCSVSGSTITMKQGSTTIATATDTTFASGSLGILANGASAKIDGVSGGW